MLKFIRLYGKWLLPIFVCFLAVAMLLTGYQSWQKEGDRSDSVVAVLADGRKLTLGDRLRAKMQLGLLRALLANPMTGQPSDPVLLDGPAAESAGKEDGQPDRWMLLQSEADRLGVAVGHSEVNTALYLAGFNRVDPKDNKRSDGLDEDAIAAFCAKQGVARENLTDALHSYLRAAAVHQLMTGSAHDLAPGTISATATPGLQRLIAIRQMANPTSAQRLSEPMLAHQVQNLLSTVSGQLVVLPGATSTRMAAETEPTEAQLKELFEQGKNTVAGEGPHRFGYRLPARVKAEAVRIPVAEGLRAAAAQITEDDVRDWFEAHPQAFVAKDERGLPKEGEVPSLTLENRKKARELLTAEKGRQLTLAFAKTAAQALAGDGVLAAANGNQLPAGTAPTALSAAVEAVRAKHGFAPELLDAAKLRAETTDAMAKLKSGDDLPFLPVAGAAEGWVTPQELLFHPTLGGTVFAERPRALAGTREFARILEIVESRDPRNALFPGMAKLDEHAHLILARVAAHLAEADADKPAVPGLTPGPALNLALPPVVAKDGTCSVVRFTAADAPRAAAGLDEVRAQVARDARTLAAYRTLADHQDALVKNAAKDTLEKFASASDKLFTVPSVARTRAGSPGHAPEIPGVGENAALVKAVFERAEALRGRPGGIKGASAEDRTVAFADDARCSVILFQIADYAPVPRSKHLAYSGFPDLRAAVHETGKGKAEDPTAEPALKQRLGWTDK